MIFSTSAPCDPKIQSAICRGGHRGQSKGYKMEERPRQCVLMLKNVGYSDAGTYTVIFPGNLRSNREVAVTVMRGRLIEPGIVLIGVAGSLVVVFVYMGMKSRSPCKKSAYQGARLGVGANVRAHEGLQSPYGGQKRCGRPYGRPYGLPYGRPFGHS